MALSKLKKKDKAADLRLRREFGITLAEYNKVLAYQGNRCAICKTPAKHFKNRLAVDHCHTTGLLRGLLCYWCNKALGVFRDNMARLEAAAEYLGNPPITDALQRAVISAPGRVGTKRRAKLLKLMQAQSE